MKKCIILWFLALLLPLTGKAATASLSIEAFTIKAGEEKNMVVNLTNPDDQISALQFDLRLPKGLNVKKDGDEYVYDMAGRTTWDTHRLADNDLGETIRFMLSSSKGELISGTEGAIISMTLVADNSFAGGDIQLENIVLKDPNSKKIQQPTYIYSISTNDISTASVSIAPPSPLKIDKGGEAELTVNLDNPDDAITMMAFDMYLPDGLTVKDYDIAGRTTKRNHELNVSDMGSFVRFILSSQGNKLLSPHCSCIKIQS